MVDGDGTFKVLAYSNCAELASIDIGGASVARLSIRDNLVFVALGQYISSAGKGGFRILDVSNPNNPVDVSGNADQFYSNDLSIIPHSTADYFYLSNSSVDVYSFNNCTAMGMKIAGSPVITDDHPTGGPSCTVNPTQGPASCNGRVDSGEELDLTINLSNENGQDEADIMGVFTYTEGDGLVTINQDTASYGVISSGGTGSQTVPYHVIVDPTANTTPMPIAKHFNLHVTSTARGLWDIPLTLDIYNPLAAPGSFNCSPLLMGARPPVTSSSTGRTVPVLRLMTSIWIPSILP